MGDLEDRLRAEVSRRGQAYSPSADFGDRIEARVRRRRRQRRRVAGLAGTAAAALVVVAVIAAQRPDHDSVRVGDDHETTTSSSTTTTAEDTTSSSTTTTGSSSTTTTGSSSTTTTAGDTTPAAGEPLGPATPLSRSGIGPIRAGMTLREAQAEAGVTITPDPVIGPGTTCLTAQIPELDLWFLASLSGTAGEDPMDGVIGSVQGGRLTVEGLAIGDPVAKVVETYGTPTRTVDYPYLPDGEVLVFESGDHAYSVTTDGTTVTELESGFADSVGNLEGCS
jgi:hypothetical protein